jgi:site-specific recombinase XerD
MEISLMEVFENYLNYCSIIKNYSPHTTNGYKCTVKLFLKDQGIKYISELNQEVIEQWFYKGRLNRKWQAETFRSHHKHLNCFAKWLVEKNYIEENHVASIEKPKLEKKLPRTLSREQAQLVLDTSYHMRYRYKYESIRNRAVIAIMLFAGLRKSEVGNLMMNDICFEKRTIFINQGKGGKDRMIPMNMKLYTYLKEFTKHRDKLKYAELTYFFLSLHKPKPFGNKGINNLIKKLRDKTKLDFSAHTLRHSFATLMLEGGCDIYTLSKIMGHSKITTTTIYLYCSDHQMSKSIEMHLLN